MLALLAAHATLAGTLELHASTPVLVRVDGRVQEYVEGTLTVRAAELKPGRHTVELSSLGGQALASASVQVPADGLVVMTWHQGRLEEQRAQTPPPAQTQPQPLPEQPAPRPPRPGPVPARPASLLIAGLAPAAQVSLDGAPLPWSAEAGGWLGLSLSGGAHRLRVVEGEVLTFDGVLELRAGSHLRCAPAAPTPLACAWDGEPHRAPPAPVPPPAPAAPLAMSDGDFALLLARVDDTPFSDDQVALVRSAARDHGFTVAQVAALLEELPFSDDKLEVVRITEPRLVNPQDAWQLESSFVFSSDKAELREILN